MNYREMLKEEFKERKLRHSKKYTMSQFAIDLELTPAFLSMIFSNKRNLNEKTGLKIVEKFDWLQTKKEHFIDLIRFEMLGDETLKNKIEEKEKFESTNKNYKNIDSEMFYAISRWYHSAIITLIGMEDFKYDIAWIARKLAISEIETELAIDRLVRLGILEKKENNLIIKNRFLTVGNNTPSEVIRNFHKQILAKTEHAIDHQDVSIRDISSLFILTDPSLINEAKQRILEFRRTLANFLSSGKKTCIYNLSTHLFRVDRDVDDI